MNRYLNFLNEADITYIHEAIQTNRWSIFHRSNIDDKESPFFGSLHLNPDTDGYFYTTLLNKIQQTIPDEIVQVKRIYFNGQYGGDSGQLHRDSFDEKQRTFLIYCNEYWQPDWGGGTIIEKENDWETVYPEPKSAIYFEGVKQHCALPISRHFKGVRITLAYKLRIK